MMAGAMTEAGLWIDRRHPRDREPLGEARNIHRGGGRFISIIGKNDLFHNPEDLGPEVVDLAVIARSALAFATVATSLAAA
jgi:hypothetical protein